MTNIKQDFEDACRAMWARAETAEVFWWEDPELRDSIRNVYVDEREVKRVYVGDNVKWDRERDRLPADHTGGS